MSNKIHEEAIGELPDGRSVKAFTLSNDNGLRATLLNYGGILVELEVPDRIGMTDDVTLGLDDLEKYLQENKPYFGALVGRYANRIAGASFKLGKRRIKLDANDGKNQLHGGSAGLSMQLFHDSIVAAAEGEVLVLSYTSPDGEMGYPGNLSIRVKIWLNEQNGLCYAYAAETDAPTVVNLTCHPYFNLAGEGSGSIRQHWVKIAASHYLPTDATGIPSGKIESVSDGPFDFRSPESLDQRLDSPNAQVLQAKGIDHHFVFPADRDPDQPVAVVTEESSGRKLEVYTSEPGVQFYTGNALDATLEGKNGFYYPQHAGFCLETQHCPDSPNQPQFPSTLLEPGKVFKSFTEYRFSVC